MADGVGLEPGRAERPVAVPVAMLAVATLLWGWQQAAMPYAMAAALAVECARWLPFRWDFSDKDFHRLADLSAVGLLVLVVVQFADRGVTGIYGVLKWFPLAVLGLVLGQLYSTRRSVKLSALFLSVRYAVARGRLRAPGAVDMRLPYLVACLLSAAAGVDRGPWLLPAEGAILVWLLLANRAPGWTSRATVVALALCAGIAAVSYLTVAEIRRALQPLIYDMMRERIAHWRDPFRSHTALGEIGRLKLSDRIVLRVEAPPGTRVPGLLREASYVRFSNNVWLAGETSFEPLEPKAEGTRWDLAEPRTPFRVVTVSKRLVRNKGMLALPSGAFRVDDLPVEELNATALGTFKIVNGPQLVRYQVRYVDGAGAEAPPREDDLSVPKRLAAALQGTLDGLDVGAATPSQVVAALVRHFSQGFRYSVTLTRPRPLQHPVTDFLQRSRTGHCEFFATATVLLLRAAGVPARYASGYSVQEYSALERAWVVRRRHAHSWAMAWVDGQWVDVDTTPAVWADLESEQAPWWQGGYDLLSFALHAWSRWRLEGAGEERNDAVLLWLLLPMTLILAWRVRRSTRVRRAQAAPRIRPDASPGPGAESDFYRVEALLAARGLSRPLGQPVGAWLAGLGRKQRLHGVQELRREILPLHYRLRFDPRGLAASERELLRRRVAGWLERYG